MIISHGNLSNTSRRTRIKYKNSFENSNDKIYMNIYWNIYEKKIWNRSDEIPMKSNLNEKIK